MVLIHKLKKVEEMDIEQFRLRQSNPEPEVEEAQAQNQLITVENTQLSQTTVETSLRRAASPPRRPLTRSQTGHVPRRRPRDDSPPASTLAHQATARKRQKAASPPQPADPEQTDWDSETEESTPECTSPSPAPPPTNAGTSTQPLPSSTSTLLTTHADPREPPNILRRNPRSRVVLPIPVPNLTKKSRGRRVPIKTTIEANPPKDGRFYVCSVDGCGKCFFRGEHLKRHIRSIHTHEKPFKCTIPLCEKVFNRHDNLLQHLKVHRDPTEKKPASSTGLLNDRGSKNKGQDEDGLAHDYESEEEDGPFDRQETSSSRTISPVISHSTRSVHSYHPTSRMIYPLAPTSIPTSTFSYSSSVRYPGGAISSPESPIFSTNMAVSSIRTEIPPSPLSHSSNKPSSG